MKKLYGTIILCTFFCSYASEEVAVLPQKPFNKIVRKVSQQEFNQQFINEENLRDGRLSPRRTPPPSMNVTPTASGKITPQDSSEKINIKGKK